MADYELDLRGVMCPVNFVKTRLLLDKIAAGDLLDVILDGGEPLESVSSSIESEGYVIEKTIQLTDATYRISIRKS